MSNYIPEVGDTCLFQGNDLEVLCVGDKMVFGAWLAQEIMVDKREVSRKKTPEQMERENAIYEAETLIKKAFGCSVDNADYSVVIQVLIEAGYRNQLKVKELNVNDYCNDPKFPALSYDQRMTLKALIQDGCIIEAKEKG